MTRTVIAALVALLFPSHGIILLYAQGRGPGAKPGPAEVGPSLRGSVVDAATGRAIPARVYIQREDGTWFFPTVPDRGGSAIPYKRQRAGDPSSVEMHTTLSPHPFAAELPAGTYTLTVERGKEYQPETRRISIGTEPLTVEVRLRRWIDMAARGWYSGDTHVHRTLDELPNVMLAEDLNVALPLLDWTREAFVSPKAARPATFRDADPRPMPVDATHVYYPRNTEYELFTIDKKPHTLGAFFVLNHKSVLELGAPPVRAIAERAHREGALIDLDKHNWPWAMMLIPNVKPDLYELANNHVWRTAFAFPAFEQPAAEYMKAERDQKGFTERGWLEFGWQNYYALLNCGFRMRPSAGTASGVHPVPLGFGRVYVHCSDKFSYETWMEGLNAGRSFVTTGPMLFARVNGQHPGHTFQVAAADRQPFRVQGTAVSGGPLDRIEIVVNSQIVRTRKAENRKAAGGGFESALDEGIEVDGSSWLVVRCFEERADGRVRFAHTAPVHIDVPGKPLRPRKVETEFLIRRVDEQIARSASALSKEAVDEYRQALRAYQEIAKTAR